MKQSARRRGLSLVETVISLVILGGAFVAVLNTVGSTHKAYAVSTDQQRARLLAEAMLVEVWAKEEYTEAGLFGLELDEQLGDRSAFDDVDDYDGWTSTPPTDADGSAIDGAQGLTRSVSVTWVDPNSPDTVVGSDQGLVRIVVTVSRGDKELAAVTAYRSDVWQHPEGRY